MISRSGRDEAFEKGRRIAGLHELSLVCRIVDGWDNTGLDELIVVEIMNENETTSGAGPERLIEEQVAKAIINYTVFV